MVKFFTLNLKDDTVKLMHLNSKTRQVWAEKTLELTNLGAASLIFGQFLSDKEFSLALTILGFVLIVAGYLISLILLQRK